MVLCGIKPQNDVFSMDGGGLTAFANLGHWLSGAFGISGPACALILYHTAQIELAALILSLGSALLLLAAAGLLVYAMLKDQSEDTF